MATPIGDIAVRVGADITPLKQGLESGSKSIGEFAKNSRTKLNAATKNIVAIGAAASAAAAVGLFAMTKSAANTAKEISNLSRVANTSTTEFQKFAFAAASLGIEQDKLADILKDVNDRVGDFLATGGGPMADFFENIAPKVGVTADQFKRLSGPEALQLYVKSLEQANISQGEMTFYLEAMASDLTNLQPLLANNGALLDQQSAKAEKFGLVLSELDIENLKKVEENFFLIGQQIEAASNIVAAKLSPVINQAIKEFQDAIDGGYDFGETVENSINIAATAFGILGNSIRVIEIGLKGAELIGIGFGAAVGSAIQLAMEGIILFGDAAIETTNSVIQALNKIPKVDIPLVGLLTDTEFAEETRAGAEFLRDQVGLVRQELELLADQELPSDKVKRFMQEASQAAENTAKVMERTTQVTQMSWGQAAKGTAKSVQSIVATLSTNSKKAFKINKAWAITDALISTYQGIAAGVKLGYPAAIPAVAAAAATGFAQVQAIRSQQFSGGGGGGNASAGGGSVGASATTTGAAQGSGGGQAQTLTIEGLSPDQLFSGAQVQSLAERLADFTRDGGEIIVPS